MIRFVNLNNEQIANIRFLSNQTSQPDGLAFA